MDLQIDDELQANTIIHIGFAKCASTTLQHLFTVHPDLTCINFHHTLELLIPPVASQWNGVRARNGFSQLLAEARDSGTMAVISQERLAGTFDGVEIATRLHALMPNARVLICIREQISALASGYKHVVRHGCTSTVSEYLMPPQNGEVPANNWECYRYSRIIGLYQMLFSKERVCVKVVEELREAPEVFYEELYRFMGIRPCASIDIHEVHHAGLSDLEATRRRLLNFFSRERSGHPAPNPFHDLPINELLKKEVERICMEMTAESVPSIEAEVRTLFKGRFAASNRELSALIGVDLAAFGYEVAPETAGGVERDIAGECEERFTLEPIGVSGDYLKHDIVKYRGLFYAVPHARGGLDLRLMSQEERGMLGQARDLNTLRQQIRAEHNRVRVVDEEYRGYKIVHHRAHYYAVPLTIGTLDAARLQALIEVGSADAPNWFVDVSEAECRNFIDDVTALHWLEQSPVYQPFYGELTDFIAQSTRESLNLFTMPAAETWAFFRLLWHGLCASLQHDASAGPVTTLSLNINNITDDMLLDCASRSSSLQPYSLASYANRIRSALLRDIPVGIQIAMSKIQLESAQGNWEAARDLLDQTMEQVKTIPGGFAAALPYVTALVWVHRLFPGEVLDTRIARRAFTLLRDLTISFLHCPAVQQAMVSTWQADAASQASACICLGEALCKIDLLAGAEAAYRAAGDLAPKNAAIHNGLAVGYWRIAEQTQTRPLIQRALVHLGRALQLDPMNGDVLVNAQTIMSGLKVNAA